MRYRFRALETTDTAWVLGMPFSFHQIKYMLQSNSNYFQIDFNIWLDFPGTDQLIEK